MVEEELSDRPPCRFCPARIRNLVVAELDSVWAVRDRHPVSEGHHLIIPKRHAPDWFSMTEKERRDARLVLVGPKVGILAVDVDFVVDGETSEGVPAT